MRRTVNGGVPPVLGEEWRRGGFEALGVPGQIDVSINTVAENDSMLYVLAVT